MTANLANDIVKNAQTLLGVLGVDIIGAGITPATVTLTEGGV